MKLDHKECYKIISTKDQRFDGIFFTAVKTTGIYCRPICKVPAPKPENCTFYHTAVEAEAHGFRPCLRCRPELAPNYSEFGQGDELLHLICDFFTENLYKPGTIKQCSESLGVTTRHINRVFKQSLGVSPQDYMMTKRLLIAKSLLTDTRLPMGEVADLSGFGSTSRFNAALKQRYGLTPSDIRKTNKQMTLDFVSLKLSYRPPYDWEYVLDFLRLRSIPGVEEVVDYQLYRRALRITKEGKVYTGWIECIPNESQACLDLRISNGLEHVMTEVVGLVRKVFDIDLVPNHLPSDLPRGLRLPGCFDAFEMSVRAILGQQITVRAATTIAGRVAKSLGDEIITPFENVNLLFPKPEKFEELGQAVYDRLGLLGVIRTRTTSIVSMAKGFIDQSLNFSESVDVLRDNLLKYKGIGPWTAEYILMRGKSWPNAFLVTDIVIKNRLLVILKDYEGKYLIDRNDLSKYKFNQLYERLAGEKAKEYEPWKSYYTLALWKGDMNER